MDAGQRMADQQPRVLRIDGVTAPTSNTRRLDVGSPKAKFNTANTAAELVEHHRGRARVHSVVPIEPAKRIERAIPAVDTIIRDHDRVVIVYPVFGHDVIPAID